MDADNFDETCENFRLNSDQDYHYLPTEFDDEPDFDAEEEMSPSYTPPQFFQAPPQVFRGPITAPSRLPPPAAGAGVPPPFAPPNFQYTYTPFKSLDEANYIISNLQDHNAQFVAIPIQFFARIRNDHRRGAVPGYIIHH